MTDIYFFFSVRNDRVVEGLSGDLGTKASLSLTPLDPFFPPGLRKESNIMKEAKWKREGSPLTVWGSDPCKGNHQGQSLEETEMEIVLLTPPQKLREEWGDIWKLGLQ